MISVLMLVYNTERYLRAAIESVLNQTLTDFELLAIDDGSSDSSGILLDEYAARDSRLRVYHIPNGGISNARNFALEYARGDYFVFVDSDDFVATDFLEILFSRADGSCRDAVMCDAIDVYPDRQHPSGLTTALPASVEGSDVMRVFLGRSGTLWNKLIGRACVGDLRFPKDMSYCEDILFLEKIASKVSKLQIVPKPLYFYRRIREGSIVSNGFDPSLLQLIDAISIACDALNAGGFRCETAARVRLCAGRVLKAAADVPLSQSKSYRTALKPLLRKGNSCARALFTDPTKNFGARLVYFLQLKASCIAPEGVVLFYKLLRCWRKSSC